MIKYTQCNREYVCPCYLLLVIKERKQNAFILTAILEFRHIFLYRHTVQVKLLFSFDIDLACDHFILSLFRLLLCCSYRANKRKL